nr:PAS domain-containing protein [Micromonospora sp. DSM 115978]
RTARVVLRNYRKDGTAFWNDLIVDPVFDQQGTLTHFVGVQTDVTARLETQQERERLLSRERDARADAERVHRQLQLLADVSAVLSGTLDLEEALGRLAEALVPTVADWCSVHLLPAWAGLAGPATAPDVGRSGARRVVTHHRDPMLRAAAHRSQELQASLLTGSSAVAEVLRTGR